MNTNPKQISLLSETDTHGNIVFVNEAFCEVSKYTREELIGKPHNIVRHPDMPRSLFERLWSTIKAGKIFRAVIKNRAKDGSHYWVTAIIMPVRENNEVTGYISVRHLIDDEQKALKLFEQQFDDSGFLKVTLKERR